AAVNEVDHNLKASVDDRLNVDVLEEVAAIRFDDAGRIVEGADAFDADAAKILAGKERLDGAGFARRQVHTVGANEDQVGNVIIHWILAHVHAAAVLAGFQFVAHHRNRQRLQVDNVDAARQQPGGKR